MTGMIYNILKNPRELKPHKTNVEIYGTETIDIDLVDSIKNKGILEPIVILEDNTILSGHRRWVAAKELKLERIPCRSMSFSDDLDEKEALVEFNRQRNKTYSQRMNEADLLTEIYGERNRKKQLETLKKGNVKPVVATLPQRAYKKNSTVEIGKTRNLVADKIGMKPKTYSKVKSIWDTAKKGDTYAKSLVEKLDKEDLSANEASNRIKVYQEAPETIKEKIIKEDLSSKEAINIIKKEEIKKQIEEKQLEKKNELFQPADIKDKKYNVIYADPPWKYDFSKTSNRDIENQYPTMDVKDICDFKIPADDDSILFLWATAPKLREALEVMEFWGFEYKTHAVWDKEMIGMGYYFRGQHELLLIGIKGKVSPPDPSNRYASVIRQKRTKHSKKPDCVYKLIEKMYPHGVYLEMFARNIHSELWDVWGNEI